jgi:hypothetical protein
MLRLIGDLPSGTPVASGAPFGWGWLAGLLGNYGFEADLVHPLRSKAIASARLKNDEGPAPRSWRSCCARTCCPRRGSPRRRSGSSAPCCGTGPAWSASAPSCAAGSTRPPPTTATTRPPATGPARAAAGWPNWTCPPRRGRSSPTPWRAPAGLAPVIERIDGELHQHAKATRGQGADHAARRRGVHRPGHGGRDRRHHPLPQRPQAGQLGRADPDGPRLGTTGYTGPASRSTRPRRSDR